jgi:hypothetical protein
MSPATAKKVAAGVLGVWGVSLGIGYAVKGSEATPVVASVAKGGKRK